MLERRCLYEVIIKHNKYMPIKNKIAKFITCSDQWLTLFSNICPNTYTHLCTCTWHSSRMEERPTTSQCVKNKRLEYSPLSWTSISHPFVQVQELLRNGRQKRWHEPEAVDVYRVVVFSNHKKVIEHLNASWLQHHAQDQIKLEKKNLSMDGHQVPSLPKDLLVTDCP